MEYDIYEKKLFICPHCWTPSERWLQVIECREVHRYLDPYSDVIDLFMNDIWEIYEYCPECDCECHLSDALVTVKYDSVRKIFDIYPSVHDDCERLIEAVLSWWGLRPQDASKVLIEGKEYVPELMSRTGRPKLW